MIISILLSVLVNSAYATPVADCIGPETADRFFVFLHGLGGNRDNVVIRNNSILRRVGEKFNIKFAVAVEDSNCVNKDGLKCWMDRTRDPDLIKPGLRAIEMAANDCFRNDKYGVVGFSSGGGLVIDILRLCSPNHFTRLIAIGSVGGNSKASPANLQACEPSLTMVIGHEDSNLEKAQKTFAMLQSRKAKVELVTVEGGHVLTFDNLAKAFEPKADAQ